MTIALTLQDIRENAAHHAGVRSNTSRMIGGPPRMEPLPDAFAADLVVQLCDILIAERADRAVPPVDPGPDELTYWRRTGEALLIGLGAKRAVADSVAGGSWMLEGERCGVGPSWHATYEFVTKTIDGLRARAAKAEAELADTLVGKGSLVRGQVYASMVADRDAQFRRADAACREIERLTKERDIAIGTLSTFRAERDDAQRLHTAAVAREEALKVDLARALDLLSPMPSEREGGA